MTAMSRLSPLIVRRTGPLRPHSGQAWAGALEAERETPFAGTDAAARLDDLKLFATGWIGGLVFFGTLIG